MFTFSEPEPEDVSWIPEAVLDVAYYLRKHKFNGYDPRYVKDGGSPRKELYGKFPSPPLMNVHWEVGLTIYQTSLSSFTRMRLRR